MHIHAHQRWGKVFWKDPQGTLSSDYLWGWGPWGEGIPLGERQAFCVHLIHFSIFGFSNKMHEYALITPNIFWKCYTGVSELWNLIFFSFFKGRVKEKKRHKQPLTHSGLDPRNQPNIETGEEADSPIMCEGHQEKREISTVPSSRNSWSSREDIYTNSCCPERRQTPPSQRDTVKGGLPTLAWREAGIHLNLALDFWSVLFLKPYLWSRWQVGKQFRGCYWYFF